MRGRNLLLVLAGALLMVTAACDDEDTPIGPSMGMTTYEVTIENLTTGQPLSPGVIVTHDSTATVWSEGTAASEGLRLIAENGDPATAIAMLQGAAGVSDVVQIDAPIHRIGGPGPGTATYQITAEPGVSLISLASMLICTNDGFFGLDSAALPVGSAPVAYMASAYDAGTENNDELFASIPDPCQAAGPVSSPADGNARPATMGVIQMHPGVSGVGDLTAAHDWSGAVARVTVRRIQ